MLYGFGPFRLDLDNAVLWQGDTSLTLRPKAFDLLAHLVCHAGQLVSKEDLMAAVWPDAVISDNALTASMSEVRRVLGETARAPQYIATAHRRGYRFIAPVAMPSGESASSDMGAALPTQAANDSCLVDRDRELGILHDQFSAMLRGDRKLVFVVGEAGIGKTTLVDAFMSQVAPMADLWLGHGQCIDHYGANEAYLPLLDALGQLGRSSDAERCLDVLRRQAPSWLLQLPALLSPAEFDALERRSRGATQTRMLRELAEAVEALAAYRPVVLVLEDLHWSDHATLDWLAFVARRRMPARLFVLGTYRPADAVVRDHPVRVVTQELRLHRQCEELILDYLSEVGVSTYLARRFGEKVISEAVSRALHRRSNGNPLFLTEIVEALISQGRFHMGPTAWECVEDGAALTLEIPETLRHFIEEQFRRLQSEDQVLLEVASIVGIEFSSATVAAGLHLSQEDVESRCGVLARNHRFVRSCGMRTWPDGTIVEQYAFTHALYQESLYEKLAPGRRVRLHQQIGAQIEASYGTRTQEIAAELAMHFERGQDFWRAIVYLQYASDQAQQRSAYEEAETYLRRGVALLAALPESPARAEHELTLCYSLGLVVAALKGLAAPEAGRLYAHAYALCQQINDVPRLFHILAGLRRFYSTKGEFQMAQSIAVRLHHLAQQSHDPKQLTESYFSQGLVSFYLGDFSMCHDYLERALFQEAPQPYSAAPASGRLTPRGDGRGGCLGYMGCALWGLGYPDQAILRSEAAIHYAEQQGLPGAHALALLFAACLRQFRREAIATQRLAETMMTLATDYSLGQWVGQSMILHGWAITLQGEGQAGIHQMRDGIVTMETTGAEALIPYYMSLLAEAYGNMAQPEIGLDVLERSFEIVDKNDERWYISDLYRLKGDLLLRLSLENQNEASVCFYQSLDLARRREAKSLELRAAISQSRLWRQQGKHDNARQALSEVYNWFTEGFDTSDLQEARAILEGLGA